MSVQKSTVPQFKITIQAAYVPAESRPDQGYYFHAYRITIQNQGAIPAQLTHRHWIITDGMGRIEEIKGAGVIGQQPWIPPGQEFQYESACPLPTPCGSMKGSYEMKTASGETFHIEIPEFFLLCQSGLH